MTRGERRRGGKVNKKGQNKRGGVEDDDKGREEGRGRGGKRIGERRREK